MWIQLYELIFNYSLGSEKHHDILFKCYIYFSSSYTLNILPYIKPKSVAVFLFQRKKKLVSVLFKILISWIFVYYRFRLYITFNFHLESSAGLSDVAGLEVSSSPQSPIVFLKLINSSGSQDKDLQVLEKIVSRVSTKSLFRLIWLLQVRYHFFRKCE